MQVGGSGARDTASTRAVLDTEPYRVLPHHGGGNRLTLPDVLRAQLTVREGTMAGVLEGVRVIDFGQYIAGPMASMLLGDQGADVIRVDPPGGPRWNTPANATLNRNKRSIVLDLKQDAGRETARRLIAGADVVVENFRPGVMQRLGLGAAEMTGAHPQLIYCSLPGFGSEDPRAQVRAWEGVIGAATGAYRATHASKGRPVYTVIPYLSLIHI